MASLSSTCLSQDRGLKGYSGFCNFQSQKSFLGSFPAGVVRVRLGFNAFQKGPLLPSIKCEKKDDDVEHISVERPPYYSYFDSTSGQMEPASGARASIPGQDYWPEGTADRVRAARAPPPTGVSLGSPSYGQKPGSRRKKYRSSANASESSEPVVEVNDADAPDITEETLEEEKNEYVVYQTEPEEVIESEYELDKKLGRPHPFIDPKVKKPIEGTLTSEELWWNWRKPEKEQWSRWQRRKPDVETVFLKAMAETGQVKLYGEHPTLTETSLYRARKHIFKEERLQAEKEKLDKIGPMAYYSEWVNAWKGDTSREAIQKHFEETGEDENTQLIEMFCYQTDREYRIMMGTDIRIKRDPLAMRLREDQIKQIWGGDPVYPTVNYIQDPDVVIDYRGPNFHEPTPNMLAYLKEHGKIISREELDKILASEKTEQLEMTDMDEAMAQAVDIGENDDEDEESEAEGEKDGEDEDEAEEEEEDEEGEEAKDKEEEKFSRDWSVMKTSPNIRKNKSKGKAKKNGRMSLEEAIDDSENLTDFLMDFEDDK